MNFLKPLLAPFFFVLLFISCSTDVELNAPKETKTFVFGLLDAKADTQFIRINRTFLGEGNNFLYANIRDSVEYKFSDFTAKVEGINSAGQVVHSFTLDTLTIQKQEGLFAERQTIYWFKTNQMDSQYDYRLSVEFSNGSEDVSASTNLIQAVGTNQNIYRPGTGQGIRLVTSTPEALNVVYNENIRIEYTPPGNAKRCEATLRFFYVEKTWTGLPYSSEMVNSELKFVDWPVGARKVDGTADIKYSVNGRGFFTRLVNVLGSSTPSNVSREIGKGPGKEEECFDFLLTVGNEDLNTWIEVNQPVTGIITERPYYSNIDGGIGLFASRTIQTVKDLNTYGTGVQTNYLPNTKHQICLNEMTFHLRFCSTSSNDISRPFYFSNRVW
jgi:hypothetical protein